MRVGLTASISLFFRLFIFALMGWVGLAILRLGQFGWPVHSDGSVGCVGCSSNYWSRYEYRLSSIPHTINSPYPPLQPYHTPSHHAQFYHMQNTSQPSARTGMQPGIHLPPNLQLDRLVEVVCPRGFQLEFLRIKLGQT